MDKEGNKLPHTNIKGNDFNFFLKRIEPYRQDLTIVCESTFNWYWLADACSDAKLEFVLAHALYLRHIHGGKNKNDRIDSEKPAHLLRANLIPPAYVYPAEYRLMRALLRQRMKYVWARASLIGHLKMDQYAEGAVPVSTSSNRDEWEQRILEQYTDPLHRLAVESDMELIRSYDKLINIYAERLVAKHGKFKGNAILSNKIARVGYFMLQNKTVFDVEQLIATSI